ncbi:hypothetical protein FN976_01120 [Caenimonas sedimenti]|uniref:Uncharacterized protein n=1 Tax=Caenimonas sedimenti TaxID=2596921 RepID=A0A562ZWW4_9BURK|nr:hypothetical protein [Caenimonas sedimenti]TWO72876.1 hypothetical protein FN976_01120 [Caenimonas sedimenti]
MSRGICSYFLPSIVALRAAMRQACAQKKRPRMRPFAMAEPSLALLLLLLALLVLLIHFGLLESS